MFSKTLSLRLSTSDRKSEDLNHLRLCNFFCNSFSILIPVLSFSLISSILSDSQGWLTTTRGSIIAWWAEACRLSLSLLSSKLKGSRFVKWFLGYLWNLFVVVQVQGQREKWCYRKKKRSLWNNVAGKLGEMDGSLKKEGVQARKRLCLFVTTPWMVQSIVVIAFEMLIFVSRSGDKVSCKA